MSNTPEFPPGWKVFPCAANAKAPLVEDWQHQATDDPTQIAIWQIEFPDCNWGLAMGASGLAALDVDGDIGRESLALLEMEQTLSDTRTHGTPGGGMHLIFSDPERLLQITASKIAPKLDTRGGANGKDSYIVVPPSSIGGKSYSVLRDGEPRSVPSFLVDVAGRRRESVGATSDTALDNPTNVARAAKLLSDYVARGNVAREGSGGDNRTYAVAAEVLNLGISIDTACDLIEKIWNPACVPPWDVTELRTKIENAANYAQNEIGAWAVPPVTEWLDSETLDRLSASVPEAPEGHPRFNWMDEPVFTSLTPPQWLLEGLLQRQTIAMMFGPSGHYKSFLALNLAAKVAIQGECAFYVAAEGIRRMARRDFPAWKLAYAQEKPLPFYMQEEMPLATEASDYVEFVDSIKAKAAGRPVGLVILDTLNMAMIGLEENSAKDASTLLAAAKFVRKALNCTVILIHHTPDNDKFKARGSSAFFAGFDTVLRVEADTKVKLARLYVQKQKNDEALAHALCFEGQRFGPGLAFVEIEAKKATLMSSESDIYNVRNVAAVLRRLKAVAPDHITSDVLAGELVQRNESDTPDEWNDIVTRVRKGLLGAVKTGKLDGFHTGEGRGIKWSLPAPLDD